MSCENNELLGKMNHNLGKIKHKIAVMSGKGGVGKSTVSVNLAYALALRGKKVGLLDADLHGPNVPLMLGVEGQKLPIPNEPMPIIENLKVVSLSFYMETSDSPAVWRGPAKIGVIRQFLGEIAWGELDYLIIDLPPGTGDEPLSIAQDMGDIEGAIIVTTPQDVANLDSGKSVKFCQMVGMPVLGIIENMSGFICPKCGEHLDIFKKGGGERTARRLQVDFLGKIPLTADIVEAGDSGVPFVSNCGSDPAGKAIYDIIFQIEQKIKKSQQQENTMSKQSARVAFPSNDGLTISSHFGHCDHFVVYNIANNEVASKEELPAPPHEPGVLPKFLGDNKVTAIICGGMGQRAIELFCEQEIDVILGASGKIDDILPAFISGQLESQGSACSHDHSNGCSH